MYEAPLRTGVLSGTKWLGGIQAPEHPFSVPFSLPGPSLLLEIFSSRWNTGGWSVSDYSIHCGTLTLRQIWKGWGN